MTDFEILSIVLSMISTVLLALGTAVQLAALLGKKNRKK